jgi:hypothetical protein
MMTDYLSAETQQMFAVMDMYEDGELTMDEAVKKIQTFAPLDKKAVKKILLGMERDNLLKFPAPSS